MDSGAPENSDNNSTKISFPASVVDDKGETWELQSDSGYSKDNAEYRCRKTGKYTNIPYYIRTTSVLHPYCISHHNTGDYCNFPYGLRTV